VGRAGVNPEHADADAMGPAVDLEVGAVEGGEECLGRKSCRAEVCDGGRQLEISHDRKRIPCVLID
jgi:hypothetical protein